MSKIIPVPLFDFVIFGATGDLTLRKLLPALFHRFRDGQVPPDSRIIGVARSRLDDAAYRVRAADALRLHVSAAALDGPAQAAFLPRTAIGPRCKPCWCQTACGSSTSRPRPSYTAASARP